MFWVVILLGGLGVLVALGEVTGYVVGGWDVVGLGEEGKDKGFRGLGEFPGATYPGGERVFLSKEYHRGFRRVHAFPGEHSPDTGRGVGADSNRRARITRRSGRMRI